ncbi:MAG: hypothetical protein ACJ71K_00150 [Nitrososphaeraceae archaeon]|jgi:hypothetical protein
MSSSRKEAVILAVILFMAVILIYSSVAKFDAFARSSTISTGCTKRDPTKPGATSLYVNCTYQMVIQLPIDYPLLCTSLSYFYNTKIY